MADTDTTHRTDTASRIRGCWTRTLAAIVRQADRTEAVHKRDLRFGDQILVTTRNSIYSLWFLGDGRFAVSGGWFDARAMSPATVTVNGCTYGGSVLWHEVVAARGLFLEFGNNVSTTRIKDVRVLRFDGSSDSASAACAA